MFKHRIIEATENVNSCSRVCIYIRPTLSDSVATLIVPLAVHKQH